uniref:Basic proline-rich protein-like n=1 Tax=Castor canadensis TaxID=51338 RepID=A0A8B7UDB3_CASCN|nr:basic proline-rich protein-like [Castor canadensis]
MKKNEILSIAIFPSGDNSAFLKLSRGYGPGWKESLGSARWGSGEVPEPGSERRPSPETDEARLRAGSGRGGGRRGNGRPAPAAGPRGWGPGRTPGGGVGSRSSSPPRTVTRHLPAGPGRPSHTGPSAWPPPPAFAGAPRLLLRGGAEPRPEPGCPRPRRAGWPVGPGAQGRPGEPGSAREYEAAAAAPSRLSRASCQPAVSPGSAAPPPPLLPPPLPHPRPPGEPPPPRRDHGLPRLCSSRYRSPSRCRPGPAGSGETAPEAAASPLRPPAHNPPRGSAGAGGPRPGPGGGGRRHLRKRGRGGPGRRSEGRGHPARLLCASSNRPAPVRFPHDPAPHRGFPAAPRCRLPGPEPPAWPSPTPGQLTPTPVKADACTDSQSLPCKGGRSPPRTQWTQGAGPSPDFLLTGSCPQLLEATCRSSTR